MKRTQLYLDEDLWNALLLRSRQACKTVSKLVRQALRERYGSSPANRQQAMQAWVGIWRDRRDLPDTATHVRRLRKRRRLLRLAR